MRQQIEKRLKEVARSDHPQITYEDLGQPLGLDMKNPGDRYKLRDILMDIAADEHTNGRPLLPAVVVKKTDDPEQRLPGQGFFTLARDRGLYDGGDRFLYYTQELGRVQEYWRNQAPAQ